MRLTLNDAFRDSVPQRGLGGCLPQVERGACRHVVPTKNDTRLVTTFVAVPSTLVGTSCRRRTIRRLVTTIIPGPTHAETP
jgi:hypothetical protein